MNILTTRSICVAVRKQKKGNKEYFDLTTISQTPEEAAKVGKDNLLMTKDPVTRITEIAILEVPKELKGTFIQVVL